MNIFMLERKELINFMKTKMDNHNDIPKGELKKFQFEIESWKRLLNSRMEENVMLKIQLSDILKNNYDQNWLEEIEAFQAQFISHDEDILMLRKNVADLYDLLASDDTGQISKLNEKKMEALRNDMDASENQFNSLMSAFNDFQNEIYKRNGNGN